MKRWKTIVMLVMCAALLIATPVYAAEKEPASPTPMEFATGYEHRVFSNGRYSNWAGVSSASQFTDEKGNFCFALDQGENVLLVKTEYGKITESYRIANPYDSFGGAVCDKDGNLYLVWGRNNQTENTKTETIFVSKYTPKGELIATASGNGSEGMAFYGSDSYCTKIPFDAGNCDIAVNGDLLVVNYAREMYSGHQSNAVFVVNMKNMKVERGISDYNSHSFDQRVSPYTKTGGFLLQSQGDGFPRAFATVVTDRNETLNETETFHFWVEEGAYADYDMLRLNKTYARLGNILETKEGAALIGSSVRSLSEKAKTESYDVFVQVFDPCREDIGAEKYSTSGVRSGIAGRNGDMAVTDYGVSWLTNFQGTGKTVDVVQAVSINEDKIVVLFEVYQDRLFDSTWYMVLNGDGSVQKEATSIGGVRLNIDEDPVYAQGAVQWAANTDLSDELILYSLYFGLYDTENDETEYLYWKASCLTDVSSDAFYAEPVTWAVVNEITTGTSMTTFSPEDDCTRGQIVTFLWRAAGEPEPTTKENPFTDVGRDAFYHKAVLWAFENGITTGTSASEFSPNMPCTRGQVVTFLWRAEGNPDSSAAVNFNDVIAGEYYADAVTWAVGENITNGMGNNMFMPNETCTRGQIVTFLYRAMTQ